MMQLKIENDALGWWELDKVSWKLVKNETDLFSEAVSGKKCFFPPLTILWEKPSYIARVPKYGILHR